MAASEVEKRKEYSFTWIIENISYCLQRMSEAVKSPVFSVNEMENTKWCLWLYPRGHRDGNFIGCFLKREGDSSGPTSIEIEWELAFLATNGSASRFRPVAALHAFSKNECWGFPKFPKRDELFTVERSTLLPEDVLTIRATMWNCGGGEISKIGQTFARTRIGVEKVLLVGVVDEFSSIRSDGVKTVCVTSRERPLMSIDISLTGGSRYEEKIMIEVSYTNNRTSAKFATCLLSLLDNTGHPVECGHEEIWFDPNQKQQTCKFPLNLTKNQLMSAKSKYLPNDTLSLQCEYTISRGVVSNEIEKTEYGNNLFRTADKTALNSSSTVATASALRDDLAATLNDSALSDVKIRTETETFQAHWFLLCARSPVFKAMFTSGMKEKETNCIDIPDVDADTVRQMLQYLHTDVLEDLDWERATLLYEFADKYGILSLKNKCSLMLKTKLSETNACKALVLADMHMDDDLKGAVEDFISEHDVKILNSDNWTSMVKSNAHLLAHTLQKLYLKNRNN